MYSYFLIACVGIILLILGILFWDNHNKKSAEKRKKEREEFNTETIDNLTIHILPEAFDQEFWDACYGETAMFLEQLDDESPQQYRKNLKNALEKQEVMAREELAQASDERDKLSSRVMYHMKELETFLDEVEKEYYKVFKETCDAEFKAELCNIYKSIINGDVNYLNETSHKEMLARLLRDRDRFEKKMFCIRRELDIAKRSEYDTYWYFRSCDNASDPDGKVEGFYHLEEFLTAVEEEPFLGLFNKSVEILGKMAKAAEEWITTIMKHADIKRKLMDIQEKLKKHEEDFDRWKI